MLSRRIARLWMACDEGDYDQFLKILDREDMKLDINFRNEVNLSLSYLTQ